MWTATNTWRTWPATFTLTRWRRGWSLDPGIGHTRTTPASRKTGSSLAGFCPMPMPIGVSLRRRSLLSFPEAWSFREASIPHASHVRIRRLDVRLRALLRSVAALHFQPESVLPTRTGARRLGLSAGRLARAHGRADPFVHLDGSGRGRRAPRVDVLPAVRGADGRVPVQPVGYCFFGLRPSRAGEADPDPGGPGRPAFGRPALPPGPPGLARGRIPARRRGGRSATAGRRAAAEHVRRVARLVGGALSTPTKDRRRPGLGRRQRRSPDLLIERRRAAGDLRRADSMEAGAPAAGGGDGPAGG